MQNIRILEKWLMKNASEENFLFRFNDLRQIFPTISDSAFKTLISRAASSQILTRACRGIYVFEPKMLRDGLTLFHIASYLRASHFNYVSLETILSEVGVISQIPINKIFIMSSGSSNLIDCGKFGMIEFVYTKQKPQNLQKELEYDDSFGMWRASVKLALDDMKRTHRNCDLIDWEAANEFTS